MSETIEYKGYTIEIEQDDSPESPREWDNLGTMMCWHRRMNLGDNPENTRKYSPIEWMIHELIYNYEDKIPFPKDSYCEDWLMEDDERVLKYFFKFYLNIPINAYEHGGITISSGTRAGWDSFDSGQLGFIYVSKEKALKEYSQKKWTKRFEERITTYLEGEIETYDQYLRGDVYGYRVTNSEGDDIDSCWGFYGEDECLKEAKSSVDWNVENDKKQEELFNKCMSL